MVFYFSFLFNTFIFSMVVSCHFTNLNARRNINIEITNIRKRRYIYFTEEMIINKTTRIILPFRKNKNYAIKRNGKELRFLRSVVLVGCVYASRWR